MPQLDIIDQRNLNNTNIESANIEQLQKKFLKSYDKVSGILYDVLRFF